MRRVVYEIKNENVNIVTSSLERAKEYSAEMGVDYSTLLLAPHRVVTSPKHINRFRK